MKVPIISTLIDKIKKYKFNINYEKCKADESLKLTEFFEKFQILKETDLYLGIPLVKNTGILPTLSLTHCITPKPFKPL